MDLAEIADQIMPLLNVAVAAGAAAGLFAVLCRLDALRYRSHRTSIVLMHVALGGSCIFAGAHALAGEAAPGDFAAVAVALCWVRASYSSWRDGVPKIYSTAPSDLDDPIPATRPPAM